MWTVERCAGQTMALRCGRCDEASFHRGEQQQCSQGRMLVPGICCFATENQSTLNVSNFLIFLFLIILYANAGVHLRVFASAKD